MKRFSLLAVVLVVALALMGIAYGLWSTMLQVNVTALTGTVDAQFVDAVATEEPEAENKDVGSCTATLSDDGDLLTIVIDNGYPYYKCNISVGIKNNGTIPVKVQKIYVSTDFNGELSGSFPPSSLCGVQIDPKETYTASGYIQVEQSAQQDAKYQGKLWMQLVQWNEYDPNAPCVELKPWGWQP